MGATLRISAERMEELNGHLEQGDDEQLAFLLAHWVGDVATIIDIRTVPASRLDIQTPWHLSLSDEERAAVIKWAHEREASLVEAHVHRSAYPAQFSPTDLSGLDAFVPHVWWRLRHRPYVALVFGDTTFDALVWRLGPTSPEALDAIDVVGAHRRAPTGRSLLPPQ
jgi:hypothetical protein